MEIDKVSKYVERLGFVDPNLVEFRSGESNILYIFATGSKKITVKTKNPIMRRNNLKREYEVLVMLLDIGVGIAPFPHNYDEISLGQPIEAIEYFEGETFSIEYLHRISEVGSLIKKIHSLEVMAVTNPEIYLSDLDFLSEIMKYVDLRLWEISDLEIPREVIETLKKVVRRGNDRIEDRKKYFLGNNLKFCHKDFKPDNIIVPPQGAIKVIDWEYANVCDPAFDLSLFINGMGLSPELKMIFIKSYGAEADTTLEQRVDTYLEYGRIPSLIWCLDRLYNPEYRIIRKDRVEKYLARTRRNIEEISEHGILKRLELHYFNPVLENR